MMGSGVRIPLAAPRHFSQLSEIIAEVVYQVLRELRSQYTLAAPSGRGSGMPPRPRKSHHPLRYMIRTKTGYGRYRRMVPKALRKAVGRWEFVISLGNDPKAFPLNYAKVHAEVEKLLAAAAKQVMPDTDTIWSAAVTSMKARGLT